MLTLRRATALGLVAACAGGLALAGAVGVPAASADSVRDGQDWALNMMNVSPAWDAGNQGQGATVAVLDSGVTPDVSDLEGSVLSGPDYTGVHTSPSNPDWGQHGTWMASIIAGHGHGPDDDDGIMGVAPKAKILSVRVIPDRNDPEYSKYEDEQEASVQDSLAKGITYAVNHGADVISMSIGYSAPSASVRSALQYAYGHGVAVIASSGNSGDTSSASKQGYAAIKFPADYPGVVGVAAVSSTGHVAGFSSNNLSVEVAAPGVNISAQGRDGQYWLVTGTSPACALVAGVAALIKAKYPSLAPDLLAKALSSTTHYQPAGGYDQNVGFGTVDAAAALNAASQLAHQHAGSTGTAASHNFGGGPAAVAADPVTPRGSGQLILFAVLAITALALVAAAVSRLAVLNQLRRREHAGLGAASVPVAGASFGRPPHTASDQPWSHFRPAQAEQAEQAQARSPQLTPPRYGAPAYGPPSAFDPSPAFDRSPSQPPEPAQAPQPDQAPRPHDPLPSRAPQAPRPGAVSSDPDEPLPSRTPPSARPRPSFHPHEPLPSRASQEPPARPSFQPHEPLPSRSPQPSRTPQSSSAAQQPPEPREPHVLREPVQPQESRDSVRSGPPEETHDSEAPANSKKPRDPEGYRAPSGWWRPSDVED
jgi:subtilisin family serine protease